MEKINLVEILKDCPTGMELDCVMYNKVTLSNVDRKCTCFPIKVKREDGCHITLTKYGQYTDADFAKCVIFPKGKTTWEGFVPPCKPCEFKDGDMVYIKTKGHNHNEFIIIFKEIKNDHIHKHVCFAYQVLYTSPNAVCHLVDIEEIRIATEEEKQKLFDAINAKGYRWNAETKTLEKLPKFKMGSRVKSKTSQYEYTIVDIRKDDYIMSYRTDKFGYPVPFCNEDNFELVSNKFDITTLKPFDKVLIRLTNNCIWLPKFFSYYDTNSKMKYYPFIITDNIGYPQCIPYKGNEHLLGKTDDCDDYYKTWEK